MCTCIQVLVLCFCLFCSDWNCVDYMRNCSCHVADDNRWWWGEWYCYVTGYSAGAWLSNAAWSHREVNDVECATSRRGRNYTDWVTSDASGRLRVRTVFLSSVLDILLHWKDHSTTGSDIISAHSPVLNDDDMRNKPVLWHCTNFRTVGTDCWHKPFPYIWYFQASPKYCCHLVTGSASDLAVTTDSTHRHTHCFIDHFSRWTWVN